MADALTKITAKTATEVCAKFALGDDSRPLLKDGMTPDQFVAVLREKDQLTDAMRFLAQALPKREAVFWAYACAKEAAGDKPPENIAKALATTHRWILDPTEDNRRAAQPAYEAADLGTPAGCTAAAVFWSGGSMAPKEAPMVPPPDHLTGHGVAGALMLAGVQKEPEKFKQKYASFIDQGLAVASGKLKWS
jgi:hypothetical protein